MLIPAVIGFGLNLSGGQYVDLSWRNIYGYTHETETYRGETYTTDSLYATYSWKIAPEGYVAIGARAGDEFHQNSSYYNSYYLIARPLMRFTCLASERVAIIADVEPGKYFSTISKASSGVPYKGFDNAITATVGVAITMRDK